MWSSRATRVGRPKPPLVPTHRNLAIDRAGYRDESAQDNGGRRANQYLVGIVVRGGHQRVGQGGRFPRRRRGRPAPRGRHQCCRGGAAPGAGAATPNGHSSRHDHRRSPSEHPGRDDHDDHSPGTACADRTRSSERQRVGHDHRDHQPAGRLTTVLATENRGEPGFSSPEPRGGDRRDGYFTSGPDVSQSLVASKVPSAVSTRPFTRVAMTVWVSISKMGTTGTCWRICCSAC